MKILKNNAHNQEFVERGFVQFPLLTKDIVEELKGFYEREVSATQKKTGGTGFHTTSNTQDTELILKVDTFLKEKLFKKLDEHLENCTYTIANFLVKEPGLNSEVSAHQDWMLVDENKYTSFNVWICLDDADYKTGNLQFIPGSHLFSKKTRTLNQSRYFDPFSDKLGGYFENILAKSGDCVIFHHSIIHASRKNTSTESRTSCVVGGYSKEAELFFLYPIEGESDKVKKYFINAETLLHMGENYLPKINISKVEIVDIVRDNVTFDKFKAKVKKQIPLSSYLKNKLTNLWFG